MSGEGVNDRASGDEWILDGEASRALARQILREAGSPARAYEPGGEVYLQVFMRRGRRDFQGGPVCWDPRERCEGVCRQCPLATAGEAS